MAGDLYLQLQALISLILKESLLKNTKAENDVL